MELLRFATAGSVDDGKSTLIGRLLYDSKSIFEDQLEAVERTSRDRGDEYINLALLTDGLRAEREQGITIDVAYRYFATPRRKFIIADTPGHIQYTRNMVTGASTADLALILVDARNGMHRAVPAACLPGHAAADSAPRGRASTRWTSSTTTRHVFDEIRDGVPRVRHQARHRRPDVHPDLGAERRQRRRAVSANMPWYDGPSLLHHLEHVHIASDRNLIDVRFPVQYVIRPHVDRPDLHDYRGYAGQVAGGVLKPGDEVVYLPSGLRDPDQGHRASPDGPVEPRPSRRCR